MFYAFGDDRLRCERILRNRDIRFVGLASHPGLAPLTKPVDSTSTDPGGH